MPDFDDSYDLYFANTRLNMHHFGIMGMLRDNLSYKLKYTYTRNYGTYQGLNKGSHRWESADPAAVFDVFEVLPSRRTRDAARAALGLVEMPKPPALAERGGVWFGSESIQLHLGVDPRFRPARKAHPAIRVESLEHTPSNGLPSFDDTAASFSLGAMRGSFI